MSCALSRVDRQHGVRTAGTADCGVIRFPADYFGWTGWFGPPVEVCAGAQVLAVEFDAALGDDGLEIGKCRKVGVHDMCGRPLRSKRNLQERCGPWSGADMCAAFDAAHTPQARMGVRGSGPIQAHALEALVVKLFFPIPSLARCPIPLLCPPPASTASRS